MSTVLEVENLNKKIDDIEILRNINFKVNLGEFVAIMGRSGSGKSTLLYNISGMDKPTSGVVKLNGKEITKLSERKLSEIRLHYMGFIFQHAYLLENLSIRDNIVLPAFKAKKMPRYVVLEMANQLMEKTGIYHVANHDIKSVSGGQLQRAAICRALINYPDILFGDEPTGALNSSTTKEVMDIINQINKEGTTVIIVTHDIKVAARAERVVFINDGEIQDDLKLGKYMVDKVVDEDESEREKKLMRWLESQGF